MQPLVDIYTTYKLQPTVITMREVLWDESDCCIDDKLLTEVRTQPSTELDLMIV